MFRRRKPLSVVNQIRAIVWPERGFRRLFSYLGQRIIRLPGTPSTIAIGVACGVFASFTPFLGLHFVIAAALAVIMRGNLLASAIGTFIGNPWTFIPIWLISYEVGFKLMERLDIGVTDHQLSIDELLSVMGDVATFMTFSGKISWADLQIGLENILLPLLVGGALVGSIAWLISFLLTFYVVRAWRRHRARQLVKAAHDVAMRRSMAADKSIESFPVPDNKQ
jgi:uncharacterized protein (DUF2062 family)